MEPPPYTRIAPSLDVGNMTGFEFQNAPTIGDSVAIAPLLSAVPSAETIPDPQRRLYMCHRMPNGVHIDRPDDIFPCVTDEWFRVLPRDGSPPAYLEISGSSIRRNAQLDPAWFSYVISSHLLGDHRSEEWRIPRHILQGIQVTTVAFDNRYEGEAIMRLYFVHWTHMNAAYAIWDLWKQHIPIPDPEAIPTHPPTEFDAPTYVCPPRLSDHFEAAFLINGVWLDWCARRLSADLTLHT